MLLSYIQTNILSIARTQPGPNGKYELLPSTNTSSTAVSPLQRPNHDLYDRESELERSQYPIKEGTAGWTTGSRSPLRKYLFLAITVIAAIVAAIIIFALIYRHKSASSSSSILGEYDFQEVLTPEGAAQRSIKALHARQSQSLNQARARYSLKTGRQPPPGYDAWYRYAKAGNCLIDDYDQIFSDFEPFYELAVKDPSHFKERIRKASDIIKAMGLGMKTIEIRDNRVILTDGQWTLYNEDWPRIFNRFVKDLPDMNLALNGRDEPRIVFNPRTLDAMQQALHSVDSSPFQHTPHPTADFFGPNGEKRCLLPRKPTGFESLLNDANAFLLNSASTQFATDPFPMLSVAKITPCFSDILVPTAWYYKDSGYSVKYTHPNDIPWEKKMSKIYWRGGGSGGMIIGDNYHRFPRFRLIDIGRNRSDIIDVKMTNFPNANCAYECNRGAIEKEYGITNEAEPREDGYKYKYLVDVDGNSFSGRYLGLLRSGSLVFKSTVFSEYHDRWLRPYVHYIPVLPDLSDLVEKVEWAIANDAEARRIQETGRLFAETVLTDVQMDSYFYLVLLEWARLQNGLL